MAKIACEKEIPASGFKYLGCISVFLDPWDCIGDDSSRLFSNFVRERTCRAGKCAGSEAWTRNWRSIGCRVASKRRNEGSQPGNFVFSGLAAAVRDEMCIRDRVKIIYNFVGEMSR